MRFALAPSPLLIGLVCAAACAVGPEYRPPDPQVPAAWREVERGVTRASPAGDLSTWWRSFDDPVLSVLVDDALAANRDLRSAQAHLREAQARRAVAFAGFFPTVQGSGSAGRNHSSIGSASGSAAANPSSTTTGAVASRDSFSAGFDASWEPDLFGGVRRGVEAATADEEGAQASVDDARVSLLAEVALNYLEVRTLQARLAVAHDNLTTQEETLQLTEWRAEAGLVGQQDVEQARTNAEQTRAQVPSLEITLRETEHTLDVLVGQPPGTVHARLVEPAALPTPRDDVAVGIPADTLRQRPDVRAAERKLAAETARLGVAEAARYPSLQLSGSIGLEALSLAAIGKGGAGVYSLLAGLTAPIFDAGRLRGQADAQDAVRAQAEETYRSAVLKALQDVENALVELARGRERTASLERAVDAAHNAARLAHDGYTVGLNDFLSVLDTQRAALALEDALAANRGETVLALVRLYKALGGGWQS